MRNCAAPQPMAAPLPMATPPAPAPAPAASQAKGLAKPSERASDARKLEARGAEEGAAVAADEDEEAARVVSEAVMQVEAEVRCKAELALADLHEPPQKGTACLSPGLPTSLRAQLQGAHRVSSS